MQVLLGRLLVKSDRSEERARGRDLLEVLSSAGRGDAKAHLANAIRAEDPVRARKLLEAAVRSYPGHAIVDLSDMLIRGEGGTKDEKRALSLLRSAPDIGSVSGALGQLTLSAASFPATTPEH